MCSAAPDEKIMNHKEMIPLRAEKLQIGMDTAKVKGCPRPNENPG